MTVFLFPETYKIDVSSLGKSMGNYETYSVQIPAKERMGVDLIGVMQGVELKIDFQFHTVENAVLVTGLLTTQAQGECARCLELVTSPISAKFTELFHYEPGAKNISRKNSTSPAKNYSSHSEDEIDEEILYIHQGVIDIEQTIINAIADELPLIPLCNTDCMGLCVQCGENLNTLDDPTSHVHEVMDERFAKLTNFFNQPTPKHISECHDGN